MTFTNSDWQELCQGLTEVIIHVAQFTATEDRRNLNNAVLALWRFGEYSMNAGLELQGHRTDRGHNMGKTAQKLHADGLLRKDYSKTVDQLESYRRKVDYLSYNRERAVHFSRQNVLDCLAEMQELQVEMERELFKARKLR